MKVTAVVPWRGGCEHRERALEWVTARLASAGVDVVLGHCEEGPWVKAVAVADALGRVDADMLVIHDADVWVPELLRAVEAVDDGVPWVAPHTLVRRLDRSSTAAVLDGGELGGTLEHPGPYVGVVGGGVVVLPRSTYERVPMDHRFLNWGQEDEAWGLALDVLAGPHVRLTGDLWHLWHPAPERIDRRIGSIEGRALRRRYERAARRARQGHGVGEMEGIVAEVRASSGVMLERQCMLPLRDVT